MQTVAVFQSRRWREAGSVQPLTDVITMRGLSRKLDFRARTYSHWWIALNFPPLWTSGQRVPSSSLSLLLIARDGSVEGHSEGSLINKNTCATCLLLCVLPVSPRMCIYSHTFEPQSQMLCSKVMMETQPLTQHNVLQSSSKSKQQLSGTCDWAPATQRMSYILIDKPKHCLNWRQCASQAYQRETNIHSCTDSYILCAWINAIHDTTRIHTHTFLTSTPIHSLSAFAHCFLFLCHFYIFPSFCGWPKSHMQQTKKPVSMNYLTSSSYY